MELTAPSFYTGIPFALLLLLIAVMPLAFPKFWESNLNKGIVTAAISIPVFIYLVISHPGELIVSGEDYFSFIILLASLFIVSGGILVTGDLRATPKVNSAFFIIGALLANVIGTTGASMLLIRPLLSTNRERKHVVHIPVFFIFLVSNIGGCLTPLADPPLFLGYLKGVPFNWTFGLFPEWLVAMALVLAVFYAMDTYLYGKETAVSIKKDEHLIKPVRIRGLINMVFAAGIVAAVFFRVHTPYREVIMAAMAVLSLLLTKKEVRQGNKFTFNAIIEVAVLFAGIFVTMVPLLMILKTRGAEFGITKSWQFFWLTGGLSSFLDNAPTYLTFFSLAQGVTAADPSGVASIAGVKDTLLRAISCGAVFMGANTYIGNGPNFMVKAICEEQKFPIPHFFKYMLYSGLILLPLFGIITLLFFRG